MIWIIIATCIAILYTICILIAFAGWKKIPNYQTPKQSIQSLVSVVIAFRNEEKNLLHLLECLSQQSYTNTEFILVNDHSIDQSSTICSSYHAPFFCYIQATKTGKKNALKEGIEKAKGELIVCTDADCLPPSRWIETIYTYWQNKHFDLLICPVKLTHDNSLFQQLQSLEFTSLIASGMGFAGAKMPIMCNGANLAFTKQQWNNSQAELMSNKASGDDMFLLFSAKRQEAKIEVLKAENALMRTSAEKSVKTFFNQRKRWASKNTAYTDWQVNSVSFIVFIHCLGLLLSGIFSFFFPVFFYPTFILFFSKLIVDSFFLGKVSAFFEQKHLLKHIPLLSLIYPFYIVVTAVSGIVGNFEWKERKF